jgi:hypothetical protein
LVEILIAIGVIVFGIMPVIGMLPTGLRLDRTSLNETLATSLGELIIADLRESDPEAVQSNWFNLTGLPYRRVDGLTYVVTSAPGGGLPAPETLYLSEVGQVESSPGDALFRVTIEYVGGPGVAGVPADSFRPLEAVVRVSWPPEAAAGAARPESVVLRASFPVP